MDELIKAICSQYTGASGANLRAKTGANIYLDTVPQNVTGTWLAFSIGEGNQQWSMGSSNRNYIQDWHINFRLCTSGAITNLTAALPLLTALYDDQLLTMTGYRMILAQRESENMTRDFETEGYVAYVKYHFMTTN
jgi:hypothetical protein